MLPFGPSIPQDRAGSLVLSRSQALVSEQPWVGVLVSTSSKCTLQQNPSPPLYTGVAKGSAHRPRTALGAALGEEVWEGVRRVSGWTVHGRSHRGHCRPRGPRAKARATDGPR